MKVDRRRALALLGIGGAATSACSTTAGAGAAAGAAFSHGVASGDPAGDGAVIWTKVTPADRSRSVPVDWRVLQGERVVRSGRATASPDRDHTVKVVVSGLQPGTEYAYSFGAGGTASPVGRFRTLPEQAADVVLAVVSCSLHPGGLFNAYDAVAKLPRVDAVVHLGDYIYEYGARPQDYGVGVGQRLGRMPDPAHEIVSLDDYRRRHAQYKSDPDLQAAHARAAWITVWDDHETTNDSWREGAENHEPPTEGEWAARKANALRAYYEWMPIREPAPGRAADMADRSFRFADIATLHMVETRLLARTKQLDYAVDLMAPGGRPDVAAFRAKLADPGRNLLGDAQLDRLTRSVSGSVRDGVAWQVLGNQVVMARVRGPELEKALGAERYRAALATLDAGLRERIQRSGQISALGLPLNLDSWDGYPAERERLYAALKGAGAHPIVLAGDSHAFWVNALKDGGGTSVAAEFGTTSVTSPGFGDYVKGLDLGGIIAAQNEEVVFSDQGAKGFTLLTLTKTEARGELFAVSTILEKPYETRSLGAWRVRPAQGAGVQGVEKV